MQGGSGCCTSTWYSAPLPPQSGIPATRVPKNTGTTPASSRGYKPIELPSTGRGAPRPVVGSRPLPKHRGRLPLGSARLELAALASTTSCPSQQHLTRSQSSPACAMHGTGSSGRGRLRARPPSRISGCRAAPRSGSADSGDWLSGHVPHRAPPRKRKFPSFPIVQTIY